MMNPWCALCLLLVFLPEVLLAHACLFPDVVQTPNTSQPWYSHVRHDRSRSKVVLIRGRTMRIRDQIRGTVINWNCTVALSDRYLVQQDHGQQEVLFACVKFYHRSKSIVQLAWSRTDSKLDPDILCAEDSLVLDPWLLVAFHLLESDFSPCSVSGGFNMKTADSSGHENPCNLMDLPMRLESDCVAGEGITFNYRSTNCLPDVAMHTVQDTVCIASWNTSLSHFTVIRRHNDHDIWCLRMPRRKRKVLEAMLFNDLTCIEAGAEESTGNTGRTGRTGRTERTGRHARHLKLFLTRVEYTHVCADEYPQCVDMPCNAYTQKECMKACHACDPRRPPAICSYPSNYRGSYVLVDRGGIRDVEISESVMNIQSVGRFQCTVFDGSPFTGRNTFTTIMISENGCRPRYTCVKINKIGPSVLAYSISQSLIWPTLDDSLGAAICNDRQFTADTDPLSDLYRSHFGTQKPIVAQYPTPISVACNLTSAYTIQATFPVGETCHGSMYEDCKERSRLRIDFSECRAARLVNEYKCIAVIEGQYWEKIVVIQNAAHENDIRCLVFNRLEKQEALVMKSGECDKFSWRFATNNVRKAILTLQIRPDMFPCKNIPIVNRTTSPLKINVVNDGEGGGVPPRSGLVTVDTSPREVTPRPPPKDDTYQHVDPVLSSTVQTRRTCVPFIATFIVTYMYTLC